MVVLFIAKAVPGWGAFKWKGSAFGKGLSVDIFGSGGDRKLQFGTNM